MDGYTLVVEIVKALAWPLSAIVLVLLLRRPLKEIVEGLRLTRVKYGEWVAEFEQAKEQATLALPQNIPPEVARPILPQNPEGASATGAILASWAGLEELLWRMAADAGVNETNSRDRIEALSKLGIITPKTVHALDGLRQMRNLAAHAPGGDTDLARANQFVTLAEALAWTLKDETARATKKPPEK
jgi:hypothetical protein